MPRRPCGAGCSTTTHGARPLLHGSRPPPRRGGTAGAQGNLDHPEGMVRAWALHALACDRCKEGECRLGEDDVVPIALRMLREDPKPARAHDGRRDGRDGRAPADGCCAGARARSRSRSASGRPQGRGLARAGRRSLPQDRALTPPRPQRLDRLPEQYFVGLLARVQAAAAVEGEPLVDLGRGNPEVGPPAHVVEALARAAADPGTAHGYAPFRGAARAARGDRRALPRRVRRRARPRVEVAVVPGTKTALVELALVLAEHGQRSCSPIPATRTTRPGGARRAPSSAAAARAGRVGARLRRRPPRRRRALPQLPVEPVRGRRAGRRLRRRGRVRRTTGAAVVHDFAYGDLVFDGREPRASSPRRARGGRRRDVLDVQVVRHGRLAARVRRRQRGDRRADQPAERPRRAGIFRPLQHAGIAALTGPQDSVAERAAAYERRRDRVIETIGGAAEGTFFVWLRLPEGLTAERLLTEHRVARRARRGLRRPRQPAGPGSRSR